MRSEIKANVNDLRADRREEVIDWVASLGVVPRDVRAELCIRTGDNQYELHLSKFVRTPTGGMQLDFATGDVVTTPLVIDLGQQESWPRCLGGLSHATRKAAEA